MIVTRIGVTPSGGSQFGELEIDLVDAGEIGRLSGLYPVTGVIFRETDPDYDYDWHCAPQRQFIVMLDSEIDVEVTSGETRRFRGGDVLLVEDTTGTGHRSRSVDGKTRRSLFLPLTDLGDATPPVTAAVRTSRPVDSTA